MYKGLRQNICLGPFFVVFVSTFLGYYFEVREIQKNLLKYYEEDFSKHAPKETIPRIQMVWDSILGQLAKENLRAKSLRAYCDKYHPDIAIRSSMSNFKEQEWMKNVPLYALAHYVKNIF